jgi:ABC-type transport system involved in cytochrome bd biosynthesis fused ATPase/permease subunit
VKKGELVAIVGAVGCGKSSLVGALLGEMVKTGGSVNVLVGTCSKCCVLGS